MHTRPPIVKKIGSEDVQQVIRAFYSWLSDYAELKQDNMKIPGIKLTAWEADRNSYLPSRGNRGYISCSHSVFESQPELGWSPERGVQALCALAVHSFRDDAGLLFLDGATIRDVPHAGFIVKSIQDGIGLFVANAHNASKPDAAKINGMFEDLEKTFDRVNDFIRRFGLDDESLRPKSTLEFANSRACGELSGLYWDKMSESYSYHGLGNTVMALLLLQNGLDIKTTVKQVLTQTADQIIESILRFNDYEKLNSLMNSVRYGIKIRKDD